ncbi:nucleotide-binding alpha-beta plait domain-containing protein [Tanacetum coccineum]
MADPHTPSSTNTGSTSKPALPGNLKLEASKLPSRPPQTLKDPLINSSKRPQKDNLVSRSGTNGSDEIKSEAVNPKSGIRGHIAGNLYGPSIRDEVNERPKLSNVLFVEGLPTDCTRREVSHLFRPFAGLKDVKVVHKLARTRGEKDIVLCFVEFANGRCALTALEALQGYKFDIKNPVSPALNIHMARFPFRLPSDGDTQYLAVPRVKTLSKKFLNRDDILDPFTYNGSIWAMFDLKLLNVST